MLKRRLKEPFGKAGLIVAVFALVFAMLGGAYAAQSNSGAKATASAKGKQGKQGKQGKPGRTGPAGPAGPVGPAGAPGAKGDTGAPGAAGTNGTNGTPGVKGEKGEEGVTGFTETLPSGKTETGNWSAQLLKDPDEAYPFAISYSIPLGTPSENVVLLTKEETENSVTTPKEGCSYDVSSSSATPSAPAGTLCVFTFQEDQGEVIEVRQGGVNGSDTPAGTFIWIKTSPGGNLSAYGTWAVTQK